jgi:hypothetical protein
MYHHILYIVSDKKYRWRFKRYTSVFLYYLISKQLFMAAVKLELSVPSSLDSIELWQYQKYMSVVEANEKDDNATEFLNMKLVEIFCDVSLKNVSSIGLSDFNTITNIIDKAFKEQTPLVRQFELGGVEFGFVPNLDKISIGEYIDIEANIFDWKNAHKAMATIFRPITKRYKEKYQIEKYRGSDVYADSLKYMPLNVALGAMVFFCRLGTDLLSHILKYSDKEGMEQIIQHQPLLGESGDGISQFTDSLEEKLSILTRQLKYLHIKQ